MIVISFIALILVERMETLVNRIRRQSRIESIVDMSTSKKGLVCGVLEILEAVVLVKCRMFRYRGYDNITVCTEHDKSVYYLSRSYKTFVLSHCRR